MVFPAGMIETVRVKICHPERGAHARVEGSTNGITANLAVMRRFLDYARNDIPVSYAKDLTVLLKDNYQFSIINYLSVQQNDKYEFGCKNGLPVAARFVLYAFLIMTAVRLGRYSRMPGFPSRWVVS